MGILYEVLEFDEDVECWESTELLPIAEAEKKYNIKVWKHD